MWGIVAAIAGTAVGLALLETALTKLSGNKDNGPSRDQKQLPKSEPGFKNKSDGTFKATLWQELSAKEILEKARRFGSKPK